MDYGAWGKTWVIGLPSMVDLSHLPFHSFCASDPTMEHVGSRTAATARA